MIAKRILWIAIGGALGANLRYWIGVLINRFFSNDFPFSTFFVNVSGSFLLGLFSTLLTDRFLITDGGLRFLIAIGFLGSYTTFSTLKYETFALASSGSELIALANVALSFTVGLGAVWCGWRCANFF